MVEDGRSVGRRCRSVGFVEPARAPVEIAESRAAPGWSRIGRGQQGLSLVEQITILDRRSDFMGDKLLLAQPA